MSPRLPRRCPLHCKRHSLRPCNPKGGRRTVSRERQRIFDDYVAPALDRREKTALFLVDSLRFEMGCDLGEALDDEGEVEGRTMRPVCFQR